MSHLNEQIVRLYDTVFDRIPDTEGLAFWNRVSDSGQNLNYISGRFLVANEFATTYGQPNNRAFVESMYLNVLDRPGERAGVDFWTAALDEGRGGREVILIEFSESAEHKVAMAQQYGSDAPPPMAAQPPQPAVSVQPAEPAQPVPIGQPSAAGPPVIVPPLREARISDTPGQERVDGTEGRDIITITGSGTHYIYSHSDSDVINGGPDKDYVEAGSGDDILYGNGGNDQLIGGYGNDTFVGGEGADVLIGGAPGGAAEGADVFLYQNISHMNGDSIDEFWNGTDKIDVRGLGITYRDGAFADGVPNQMRVDVNTTDLAREAKTNAVSIISVDSNGDNVADISMRVVGAAITQSDFLF